MDDATRAWLLAQLGAATDPADLDTRYTRLHSARAVASEVLRERHAALLAQPARVGVSGVVSVDYAETIKALERKISLLEAGQPPAPDDPPAPDTGGVSTFPLMARGRR
ncbi:MAG TPA: hypothetical protein VFY14_20955 [Streptomyces sp.]|nr:hypothetical protein [Streptomyces sp.]